jgi:predicted dehydrogenase
MYHADFLTQDLYFYENNYTAVEWDSLQVFRGMSEGDMVRYRIDRDEPLRLELEAFARAVETGEPFLVTGEDGLRAMRLALLLGDNASQLRSAADTP